MLNIMKKFTIKVDLSSFFEDERKFVIVLVHPQWENVEFLQRRVEKIFKLNNQIQFVTDEGYFIPPEEQIEVIKYIDKIRAFPTQEQNHVNHQKKKKIKNNLNKNGFAETNVESMQIESEVLAQNKRKFSAVVAVEDFTTSTPKCPIAKRSKGSSVATKNGVKEKSLKKDAKKEIKYKKKKILENNNIENITEKYLLAPLNEIELSSKKKQQHEESKHLDALINLNASCDIKLKEEPIENIMKPLDVANSKNSSHLHFDETGNTFANADKSINNKEIEESPNNSIEKQVAMELKFNCELSKFNSQAMRTFNLIRQPKSQQEQLKIIDNVLLTPSNKLEIAKILNLTNNNKSQIIYKNDSVVADKSTNLTSEIKKMNNEESANAKKLPDLVTKETSNITKSPELLTEEIAESPESVAEETAQSPKKNVGEQHSLALPTKSFQDSQSNNKIKQEQNNNNKFDLSAGDIKNKTTSDASDNSNCSNIIIDLSESDDGSVECIL